MANNIEDIRVIYIRALKHLLALVISIRSNTESELNEFITKDLEKFEGEIRQLKIQYEEVIHQILHYFVMHSNHTKTI
jgi:hypothetical protein